MGGRPRYVPDAMRRQHPGPAGARAALEPRAHARAIHGVEASEELVEQQQARPRGERARDQHEATFAEGQREETPAREALDREIRQRPAHGAACLRVGRIEQDVGAEMPGCDDALDRRVPAVAVVAVLALRTEIGHLGKRILRGVLPLAAEPVAAPLAARRFRPDRACHELEQLRLARTVGAEEQPALARRDLPPDVAQHGAAATVEVDVRELDREMARRTRLSSHARRLRHARPCPRARA